MSTDEGQAALRRVLLAFSAHQPQVMISKQCKVFYTLCVASMGAFGLMFVYGRQSGVQVGYCQSMNYLAAMLLLALDRAEEKAFWVLVSLIDDGGKFSVCDICCSIVDVFLA